MYLKQKKNFWILKVEAHVMTNTNILSTETKLKKFHNLIIYSMKYILQICFEKFRNFQAFEKTKTKIYPIMPKIY